MKKKIILILVVAMLVSSIAYGVDYSRVQSLGLIGQGVSNWDNKISRAELATVAVKLNKMDHLVNSQTNNVYKDVSGWATGYINLANTSGLMSGTSKTTFNPKANVTYVELLTMVMRVLEYKDGVDFTVFPDDYYEKSIELGLGNMYINPRKVITRGEVAEVLDKSLDMKLKDKDITLGEKLTGKSPTIEKNKPKEKVEENGDITISNMRLITNIASSFTGTLNGRSDFTGYKIILSSRNDSFSKSSNLQENGKFSIENFSIDTLTKLLGYKVEVVDTEGRTVYKEDLE